MNVREVIRILKGYEGHQVLIDVDRGDGDCSVYAQECVRVEHLPVDQRQRVDQGNVILWDGHVDGEGLPAGMTFWARDVRSVVWCRDGVVRLVTHSGWVVVIVKSRKIGD